MGKKKTKKKYLDQTSEYARSYKPVSITWPSENPDWPSGEYEFTTMPEVEIGTRLHEMVEENLHDPVNHPKHYVGQVPGVECQQVIGWFPHHVGAAMKYLWRHTGKGGVEDLRKAIKFIEFEIARLETNNGDLSE